MRKKGVNGKFLKSLKVWCMVELDQSKKEQLFAFSVMKMESLDTSIFMILFQW